MSSIHFYPLVLVCNVQEFHLVESDRYTAAVVAEAKGIWSAMQDPSNREVKMTHDGQFSGMLIFVYVLYTCSL